MNLRMLFAALFVASLLALPTAAFAKKAKEPTTVVCKDGTSDEKGRGACRGHGGVDKKATADAKSSAAGAAAVSPAAGEAEKGTAKKKKKNKERQGSGKMVVCKDGVTDQGGRGACRGHGGVDKKATKSGATGVNVPAAAVPADSEPEPAAQRGDGAATRHEEPEGEEQGSPTAQCKDGTVSHAQHHTGACSNHGGVEEWLDGTQKN